LQCPSCKRSFPDYVKSCPYCQIYGGTVTTTSATFVYDIAPEKVNDFVTTSGIVSFCESIVSGAKAQIKHLKELGVKEEDIHPLESNVSQFESSVLDLETKFNDEIKKKDSDFRKIQQEAEKLFSRNALADAIISRIRKCNLLFESKTKAKQFKENIEIANQLHTPCDNEKDFIIKIGILPQIFDVELTPLKNLVTKKDGGSINLIEQWLNESGITYDNNMILTWYIINKLRNDMEPFHTTKTDIIKDLEFFGHSYPVTDYSKLWEDILKTFWDSLAKWLEVLQSL